MTEEIQEFEAERRALLPGEQDGGISSQEHAVVVPLALAEQAGPAILPPSLDLGPTAVREDSSSGALVPTVAPAPMFGGMSRLLPAGPSNQAPGGRPALFTSSFRSTLSVSGKIVLERPIVLIRCGSLGRKKEFPALLR